MPENDADDDTHLARYGHTYVQTYADGYETCLPCDNRRRADKPTPVDPHAPHRYVDDRGFCGLCALPARNDRHTSAGLAPRPTPTRPATPDEIAAIFARHARRLEAEGRPPGVLARWRPGTGRDVAAALLAARDDAYADVLDADSADDETPF